MKVGVIGSRTGFSRSKVFSFLDDTIKPDDIIVSGGANGVDSFAEEYADLKGLTKLIYKPDFSKGYDVKKYFERNKKIIETSDLIIAFWDKTSKGTKFGIEYAKSLNKDIVIVNSEDKTSKVNE